MDLTVENLCGLLKRSRLVPPESVHPLYDRWRREAKDKASSTSHFTRWLVAQNLLTEYQAGLLAKGAVDDFFLGDYKILERVGRGRMAGVYKAQHANGSVVAIKVLPPSRTKVPALMARFQREAELAVTFRHPNVVRSYGVGQTNGLHYIVMELLDGDTVEEVLARRKKLPPAEAVNVIYQTLLGLEHLHELGVVHRDLKPANLMLVPGVGPGERDTTRGRTVKVLDIGLARRMFDEQTPADNVDPTEVTREGVILGTPDYLSPEQARDPRTIDIRSDIYSLGCVLYHLLTGQTPFPSGNLLKLMLRHATEKPKPLAEFAPGIPDGLQQIVDYMMAKSPDQRYPTPARAASALQTFLVADEGPPQETGEEDATAVISLDQGPPKTRMAPRPARKSGKMEVRMPAASAPLPQHIELVPLGASPDEPGNGSPFATSDDDSGARIRLPRMPRRLQGKKNRLVVLLTVGIVGLVAAIGFVVAMMMRR